MGYFKVAHQVCRGFVEFRFERLPRKRPLT
jgi:hypothetical protein